MRKILTGLTLSILLILGACSSGTGDEKGNSSVSQETLRKKQLLHFGML